MNKNKKSLLNGLLEEQAKATNLSPNILKKLGDEFINIDQADLAKICFSSAQSLAQSQGNIILEQMMKKRVFEATNANPKIQPSPEKRVIAKAFFQRVKEPDLRPEVIRGSSRVTQDPPSLSSIAGYTQWAKAPLTNFISCNRTNQKNDQYIQILRRYSSFSVLLDSTRRYAIGGGYFISHGGFGLVLDPGHNFIQSFLGANHSIRDIDTIIVTHAHDDHMGGKCIIFS